MARFVRRFHHHGRGRKLPPLAIVGISLGGAVLLAILIGNLLRLSLDEETLNRLEGGSTEPPAAEQQEPQRTAPSIRAYPIRLGDAVDPSGAAGELLPGSVTVSINTPTGEMLYTSPVVTHQGRVSASKAELREEMFDLTAAIPYVCGIFYPQTKATDDGDLLYAAAASDAALLREFLNAGASEILLVGMSFETEDLPYLADYLTRLREMLKGTPIGLAIPPSVVTGEENWQLLPALRQLSDYLAIDLQAVPDANMEEALLNAHYYALQYEMSLLVSSEQSQWISAVETAFSDYRIAASPPKAEENAQG